MTSSLIGEARVYTIDGIIAPFATNLTNRDELQHFLTVVNTTSWRITAPMRRVKQLLSSPTERSETSES